MALMDVARDADARIPELLVVGVGPIAAALASLSASMGYHVRVAAGPRPPRVGEFDDTDELIVTADPLQVVALRPRENTYVVICDDGKFSQEVLRGLLEQGQAPYIGMVSDALNGQDLLAELIEEGFTDASLSRVRSPAGLDLNAETPEEVALSALAQVVAFRRGGTGGHLQVG